MNLSRMKASETTEQIKLFNWAERTEDIIPELALMHHIPNEGKRTNGSVLKAMGMKAGVPDILLPVRREGYSGLYIEMKYNKNVPTLEQQKFLEKIQEQKYKTAVCYSFEEARDKILEYLTRKGHTPLKECLTAPRVFGFCEGLKHEGGMFTRTSCSSCPHFKPGKEESVFREALKGTTTRSGQVALVRLINDIINLTVTRDSINYLTPEQSLEHINKELALLAKEGHTPIKHTAAVLDVAIKAYEHGKKRREKEQ